MEDGDPLSGSECDFPLQHPQYLLTGSQQRSRYTSPQDSNNNNSANYTSTYNPQPDTLRTGSSDKAVDTSEYIIPVDSHNTGDRGYPVNNNYLQDKHYPVESILPETAPKDIGYPEGNPMHRKYLEGTVDDNQLNPEYKHNPELRTDPVQDPLRKQPEDPTSVTKPYSASCRTSSASLPVSSTSTPSVSPTSGKATTEHPPLYSQQYLDYLSGMAAQPSPSGGDTIEGIASNFMERIKRTEEENEYLKEKVKKLDDENKRLLDDKIHMAEKMRPMEDQKKRLTNENQLLRTELESMSKANQKLRDDIEAQNKKLAEAKKESSVKADRATKEQIEKLEDKVKELEHEKTKAADRAEAKDKENETMDRLYKEELDKMKQEVDKAYDQCKQMKDKVHSLEDENRRLKDQPMPDLSKGRGDDKVKRYIEDLKREIRDLEEDKVNLRRAYDDLKQDYDKLKDGARSRRGSSDRPREGEPFVNGGPTDRYNDSYRRQPSTERMQTPPGSAGKHFKEMERQADSLKATNASLSHLLREKEDYIKDLEDEKKDLRAAIDGYKKELERIRINRSENVKTEKYQDMADKHRKLLEENKRLRTLMAHRNIEDTASNTERLEMKDELDHIKGKLDSANNRVKQLEGYMDEIFEDENFAMVNKNRSSGSLPEIRRSPVIVVDPHYMTPRSTRKTRSSMSMATPRSVPKPSGAKTYSNYTYKPGWTAKF